jgi:hypothetical protein
MESTLVDEFIFWDGLVVVVLPGGEKGVRIRLDVSAMGENGSENCAI